MVIYLVHEETMTSLRVALKLSMAANQGTPSTSSQNQQLSTSTTKNSKSNGTAAKISSKTPQNSTFSTSIPQTPSTIPTAIQDTQTPNNDAIDNFPPLDVQDDDSKLSKKNGSNSQVKNAKKDQTENLASAKKRKRSSSDAAAEINALPSRATEEILESFNDKLEIISTEGEIERISDSQTLSHETSDSVQIQNSEEERSENGNHELEVINRLNTESLEANIKENIENSASENIETEVHSTVNDILDRIQVHSPDRLDFTDKGDEKADEEKFDIDGNNEEYQRQISESPVADEEPDVENLSATVTQSAKDSKKSVKRKRTPSILKALDRPETLTEKTSVGADSGSEGDSTGGTTQRYQSNRAAAKVAKTKFNGRSKSGDEDDNGKTAQEGVGRTDKHQPPQQEWVMCDLCKKWRSVAAHIKLNDLPDEWFCKLNTWNMKYNHCDAPEESYKQESAGKGRSSTARRRSEEKDDLEKELHAKGRDQDRGNKGAGRGFRGRWSQKRRQACKGSGAERDDNRKGRSGDSSDDGEVTASARKKQKSAQQQQQQLQHFQIQQHQPQQSLSNVPSGVGSIEPLNPVNWVMCNKCEKWRKVPRTIDVESLPDTWYCSLNTWVGPSMARCSVAQEEDDTALGSAVMNSAEHLAASLAATRPRRAGNGSAVGFGKSGEIKNTQWVQCEHRNCKKWRKVPAHIDTNTLPDIWYCEMNNWDAETANCTAPAQEDSDIEPTQPDSAPSQGKKPTAGSHNLITSNSKGPGTLSYRRIIFGADGRIRGCFSDKNNNGFGIFSFPESTPNPSYIGSKLTQLQQLLPAKTAISNGSTEPRLVGESKEAVAIATNSLVADYPTRRVAYWWSSAYDESAATYSGFAATSATKGALTEESEPSSMPSTTYLLDAVRKISGYKDAPCPSHMVGSTRFGTSSPLPQQLRKTPRSWRIVSEMTIFQRDLAECCAVRSCFLLTPSLSLDLPLLVSLMESVVFQKEDVDAAREQLLYDKSLNRLRNVFRRLEERGEAEVSYTASGNLSIQLLYVTDCPALHSNMNAGAICAWNKQEESNIPIGHAKWVKGYSYRNSFTSANGSSNEVKKVLPPKMRKFYDLQGHLRSDRKSIPDIKPVAQRDAPPPSSATKIAAAGSQRRKSNPSVTSTDIENATARIAGPTGKERARKKANAIKKEAKKVKEARIDLATKKEIERQHLLNKYSVKKIESDVVLAKEAPVQQRPLPRISPAPIDGPLKAKENVDEDLDESGSESGYSSSGGEDVKPDDERIDFAPIDARDRVSEAMSGEQKKLDQYREQEASSSDYGSDSGMVSESDRDVELPADVDSAQRQGVNESVATDT